MGILNDQPKPMINHLSHSHPLHIIHHNPTLTLVPSSCSGCKLPLSQGLAYCCNLCKYYLHIKCSEMPQKIKHPVDKLHAFYLLPTPVYPEGFFKCDACGEKGNGFSYHCKECGIDLHILCASMPLSTTHHLHHHEMKLVYLPAFYNDFFCNVCNVVGGKHWRYRCDSCDFDAHLSCGTSNKASPVQAPPMAQMYQQTPSVPVQVVQPPPQMPAHMQQYWGAYGRALGVQSPGSPNMSTQPFNFMNYANTGVTGPNMLRTNSAPPMNQGANSFYNGAPQGVNNFYNGAPQYARQQTFPVETPAPTTSQEATLQLLQQLVSNNNSGDNGTVNVNLQLLQALLNANANANGGGGGGGGNDQLLQNLMGGGGGGGGFDINSLLGGNFDMSSLLGGNLDVNSLVGLMGGFGF